MMVAGFEIENIAENYFNEPAVYPVESIGLIEHGVAKK